jgi:hypothetical protein
MDFSAKWDPIPSMLCQNHTQLIKGFMGQTTSFDEEFVKSSVLVMGSCELNGEARYIHGQKGKGFLRSTEVTTPKTISTELEMNQRY